MKIKNIFIFMMLAILSFNLIASNVDLQKAKQAASNFLYQRSDISEKSEFSLSLQKEIKDKNTNEILCYVFAIKPQGFIIMSADDNLQPVLGYSYDDNFSENTSPSFNAWMNGYYVQISSVLQNKFICKEKKSAWAELENKSAKIKVKAKLPMITTKWDQGKYYNALCPADSLGPDGHAVVGCVATAMGQVMKFWNYPEHGNSGYAYQHIPPMFSHNYGKVQANFAATYYDWSNMPTNSNNNSKIAVSTLLFNCGISVKMNYGPAESGSMTEQVPSALCQYFKYSPAAKYVERKKYKNAPWDSLIMCQLNIGLPVIYSGSGAKGGHCFVVDGYQDSSYFHVNWGWSGSANGYYYFTRMVPSNDTTYDFTNDQGAVIDIYPLGHVSVSEIEVVFTKVFPNPANDFIQLDGVEAENTSVQIFNNIGQLVIQQNNSIKIDVSNLENGLYFVKLKTETKNSVTKVIIQR